MLQAMMRTIHRYLLLLFLSTFEVLSQLLLEKKDIFFMQTGRLLNTIWTLSLPATLHSFHSN